MPRAASSPALRTLIEYTTKPRSVSYTVARSRPPMSDLAIKYTSGKQGWRFRHHFNFSRG